MEEEFFDEEPNPPRIKRAVIAGASEALKIKAKEWRMRDEDILQDITERVDEIVEGID
tara:strand:+ start:5630 stop:5803 length:174 start_codon:yes stop_codon:yes gene_type:complete